nr:MAG TPA: hypothetical protein [Caudoviricetes sp.]
MDCRDTCSSAVPSRLVQPPCFICRGVSVSIPPAAPGAPTDDFGVSPSPFSLKPDGTLIVGTGINGTNASVGTDGVIELFVAPFIGDVSGSELTYPYSVELQPGQELAFAFGATLKSGYGVRITEYYDVTMILDFAGVPKTFHLIPANTKSGYIWTDGAGYNITDSDGDLHTVQNVTRPAFFGFDTPGSYGIIITAHSKITNLDTAVIAAPVTVTYAD